MEYRIPEPPFKISNFNELTREEAQQHFKWFILEIPTRIQNLQLYFKNTGGGEKEQLDFSVDSLQTLWSWYVPNIKIRNLTDMEMEAKKEQVPEWVAPWLKDYVFSFETLALAMDIGIYFGEVFIQHNHEQCMWQLLTKPKSDADFNRPIIKGFGKVHLNPITVVTNMSHKVVRGERDNNLLVKMYDIWNREVPK